MLFSISIPMPTRMLYPFLGSQLNQGNNELVDENTSILIDSELQSM